VRTVVTLHEPLRTIVPAPLGPRLVGASRAVVAEPPGRAVAFAALGAIVGAARPRIATRAPHGMVVVAASRTGVVAEPPGRAVAFAAPGAIVGAAGPRIVAGASHGRIVRAPSRTSIVAEPAGGAFAVAVPNRAIASPNRAIAMPNRPIAMPNRPIHMPNRAIPIAMGRSRPFGLMPVTEGLAGRFVALPIAMVRPAATRRSLLIATDVRAPFAAARPLLGRPVSFSGRPPSLSGRPSPLSA
jgi:hypothetical protein